MNKRAKYKNCPLVEVIFQLRFPTILSINTKQPAEFQEKIRIDYPYYDEGIEEQNESPLPMGNSCTLLVYSLQHLSFQNFPIKQPAFSFNFFPRFSQLLSLYLLMFHF